MFVSPCHPLFYRTDKLNIFFFVNDTINAVTISHTMGSFQVYGFCLLVTASVVALIAMSTEYIVSFVDDILVPCQHDSVLQDGKCVCDNTGGIFSGQYCEQCNCDHAGLCTMTSDSNSGSRWGCRCPTHQKWVGLLCDKCYAKDHTDTHCRGDCRDGYYGPQCNTLCVADGRRTDLGNQPCQEILAGGGTCNACNGHGACSSSGQCVCESGYFTARNGEQCGATCPIPCVHGVCQEVAGMPYCLCESNFFGSSCEDTCPGNGCHGHGTCAYASTGVLTCTCDAFHRGDACQKTCPGSGEYPVPCSGHGTCSEDAQCTCDPGWEGEACACSPLYTCSGHGACGDTSECVCRDTTEPDSHFDGAACERCAPHWFGSNCHLQCDAAAEYLPADSTDRTNIGCNGHGACTVSTDGHGEFVECACQGTDPDTFCAQCLPGYYPDIRLPNLTVAPCSVECHSGTCFHNGVCNDAYDGSNHLCTCDKTQVVNVTLDTLDPARFCATCKENWFPDDMSSSNRCTRYCASDGKLQQQKEIYFQLDAQTIDVELMGDVDAQKVCARSGDSFLPDADCRVCSDQGTCGNDGECQCDAGTTGVYCNINCGMTSDGSVCSNHGRCVRNDLDMWFSPYSDTYRCECTPYDTYTAETRIRLAKQGVDVAPPPPPEYYGEFCEFHCPRYNEEICNDRGDCSTAFSVNAQGDLVSCLNDTQCADMAGSFCHRMQTPWDSLMTENVNAYTRSFFSNGVDSPGYIKCADSDACLDTIYSIQWDDFCVNMLNGWYPNDLNTATCAYAQEGACQSAVESFFMDPYDGEQSWCESVKEKMIPPDDTCSADTHADPTVHAAFQTACQVYTLESTCNAQSECIYDQTQAYIRKVDADCASRTPSECQTAPCRLDGDTCKVETYCRAKHCQDAMFEKNIEHACFEIEPACAADHDWTQWCGAASGQLREDKTDRFSSLETFYGCYMYARRDNPQTPEAAVPGGMTIRGSTTLYGQDVSLQSMRRAFLDSRVTVDVTDVCYDTLQQWSYTSFCDTHLDTAIPSWYNGHLAPDNWFMEWLVACTHQDHLFKTESEANDFMRTHDGCAAYYKGIAETGNSFNDAQDAQDTIGITRRPWTRYCPNEPAQSMDTWTFPAPGCRDEYNEIAGRWGATAWTTADVAQHFHADCEQGLDAPWIPKAKPFPTLCDLGACGPSDTCFLCSDEQIDCGAHQTGVLCETDFNMDCELANPCQKDGACHQPGGMLGSATYVCAWPDTVAPTSTTTQCASSASSFNWYTHCDSQPLGITLDMTPGGGLGAPWSVSGNVFAVSPTRWLVDASTTATIAGGTHFKVIVDATSTGDLTVTCDDASWTAFDSGHEAFTVSTTAEQQTIAYEQSFTQCAVSSVQGDVLLAALDVDYVTALRPFGSTLDQSGRTFPTAPTNTSQGYEAWSFDWPHRAVRVQRAVDDIPARQECTIEQGQKVCPARAYAPTGVSWDMGQAHASVRVRGHARFSDSETRVANVAILNGENTELASLYVQSRRGLVENLVFVNGVQTRCEVPTAEWWSWQVDIRHVNETRTTVYNHSRYGAVSQVFEQEWHISVRIGDCTYEVPQQVTSGVLERSHRQKIAPHFLSHAHVHEAECRTRCLEHSACAQWSWTANDRHCYLHAVHCGEDTECTHGDRLLRALASHKARHVHVYAEGGGAASSFAQIRVEPLLDVPTAFVGCGEPESVPVRWQEDFTWQPLDIDTTMTCNRLASEWSVLHEYPTRVCGDSAACRAAFGQRPSDLQTCGAYVDARVPEVDCSSPGQANFLNLNWTAYCLYAQSFDTRDTIVPFLGGVYPPMHETCVSSNEIVQNATDICGEAVPSNWYQQCFSRTSSYEPFCSADCLEYIDDMLADSSTGPGLCTVRESFLNLSSLSAQGCDCDMRHTMITDFCLLQGVYHEDDKIRVPELDHSQCSVPCNDMLRDSFNRSQWRQWCASLANKDIKGVCSKTVCECNQQENKGAAGDRCELECPTGVSETQELACSGPRNGKCFASVPSEQIIDIRQETSTESKTMEPLWMKGPKPFMTGYCQCALGSGMACSIPCDRCNNGTYGEALTSQYGICNTYNGVCRSLPPFMRFDVRFSADVHSYNTTMFEDRNGVSAWTYPDRFLYESDRSVLTRAVQYIRDPEGLDSGHVTMSPGEGLAGQQRVLDTLQIMQALCWTEQDTHPNLFEYLDNEHQKVYHGLSFSGNDVTTIGSYDIDSFSGTCQPIELPDSVRLCFDDGRLWAYLNHTTSESLRILETRSVRIPKQDVSFAVRDRRTVYAFGGRNVYASSEDVFDDVYVFYVRHAAWQPRDIVFVDWHRVEITGSVKPAASFNTPMLSFTHDLYVFQEENGKTCAYRLRLPSGVNMAEWFRETCHTLDAPVAYVHGQEPFVYVVTTSGTGYTYTSQTWSSGAPASTPVTSLTPNLAGLTGQSCEVRVAPHGLDLGGTPFAMTTSLTAEQYSVRLFLDELIYIDVNADAGTLQRAMDTIQWRLYDDPTEMTRDEVVAAFDLVERVHQHQARWSKSAMTRALHALSDQMSMGIVQSIPIASVTPPDVFLNMFSDVPLSLLASRIKTTPTDIPVFVEGEPRELVFHATYQASFESYVQEIDFGPNTLVLTVQWRTDFMLIRLAPRQGPGLVQWVQRDVFCKSWTLVIPLEAWINGASEFADGWRGLFNLYMSPDVAVPYSTSRQVSSFLAYSPGHCSVTADESCPGMLPYVHLPCSGRGKCTTACRCICEEAPSVLATQADALDSIDVFNSPWRGKACEITCPGYDGYHLESICSGRGTCQAKGKCSCDQGYTGDACQFECPKDENNFICSTHGACGTKAYEVDSFVFTHEDMTRDTLVATNRREYANALRSFYDSCAHDNYVRVSGTFEQGVHTSLQTGFTAEEAFELCEGINRALNLDLAQEEFRIHPSGRCVGVTKQRDHLYTVQTLSPAEDLFSTLTAIVVFECVLTDCAIEIDAQDDRSISGLRYALAAPTFSFTLDYVHGESSGQTHFIVNNEDMYLDVTWDESGIVIRLGNDAYGLTTVLEKSIYVKRVVLTIEDGRLHTRVFPFAAITPGSQTSWYAPDYNHKYMEMAELPENAQYYNLLNTDTGVQRRLMERAEAVKDCDKEPVCTGLLRWRQVIDGTRYALVTDKQYIGGEPIDPFSNDYTFHRKMSFVYKGKERLTDACSVLGAGLSRYPTASYTEHYNTPLKDVDIAEATDNETQSVVVGRGLWTDCWERVGTNMTKVDCYQAAYTRVPRVYGFAHSDEDGTCLVYVRITDPSQIQLNEYSSQAKLTQKQPCGDGDTRWFT